MDQLMFLLLAATIVVFGVLTVTSRKILRAAVYLLFVLVATAGIYFQLNYNFLAAVQLTVYAGGIVVLIIFSILLTSHISENMNKPSLLSSLFSALAAGAGAILVIATIFTFTFTPTTNKPIGSDVHTIGTYLISYKKDGYALPFEVISILLLAAMIAAIVIAKKEKIKES
jgi:NADH-quinone oxidoreductase subunit J